jgi:peptide/nickel transport system permease protein
MRVVPGAMVDVRFAGRARSRASSQLDIERQRLGLDKPLWQQFLTWMGGLVRLDFGRSM